MGATPLSPNVKGKSPVPGILHFLLAAAITPAASGASAGANATPGGYPLRAGQGPPDLRPRQRQQAMSEPLRFLVDTGADGLAISRAIVPKASVVIDDRTENTGSDGVTTIGLQHAQQRREIGGLHTRMGAVVVDYRNRPFDAVLGWKFFEGKVVEIDYDRQQLLVHRSLPDVTGYTRANVRWIDNTPAIEVTLGNGDAVVQPWLALDTGSNGSVDLSYAYSSPPWADGGIHPEGGGPPDPRAARAMSFAQWMCACHRQASRGWSSSIPQRPFQSTMTPPLATVRSARVVLRQFNMLLDMKTGEVYLRRNQDVGVEPGRK